MKEQGKAIAGDLSKTNISNIPAREFKAMIIRILTGLEKRVDSISETINTEIKNDIVEIKGSINRETHLME